MKLQEWSQRVLWFVFGAVSIGVLLFISTSFGKTPETALRPEHMPSLEQRVGDLEREVKKMQKQIEEMGKSLSEKQDRMKEGPNN